jgi:hypothetical protein
MKTWHNRIRREPCRNYLGTTYQIHAALKAGLQQIFPCLTRRLTLACRFQFLLLSLPVIRPQEKSQKGETLPIMLILHIHIDEQNDKCMLMDCRNGN